MNKLTPKEQHERLLTNAHQAKIAQYLENGREQDVTKIAVTLARQCDLLVHFQRLWKMRVSDLDARLSSEGYMKDIFMNKGTLYKQLNGAARPH